MDLFPYSFTRTTFLPISATISRLSYRFHQAAGAAVELPAAPCSGAGHGQGHGPGSPGAAAALRVPGAAVHRRQAAVELLRGLGAVEAQRGDALLRPATVAGCGRGSSAQTREGGGGMASLQQGTQAGHC